MSKQEKETSSDDKNIKDKNEANLSDNQLQLSLINFITNPSFINKFKNFIADKNIIIEEKNLKEYNKLTKFTNLRKKEKQEVKLIMKTLLKKIKD